MRFKTIDLAAGAGEFEFQLHNLVGQTQPDLTAKVERHLKNPT